MSRYYIQNIYMGCRFPTTYLYETVFFATGYSQGKLLSILEGFTLLFATNLERLFSSSSPGLTLCWGFNRIDISRKMHLTQLPRKSLRKWPHDHLRILKIYQETSLDRQIGVNQQIHDSISWKVKSWSCRPTFPPQSSHPKSHHFQDLWIHL